MSYLQYDQANFILGLNRIDDGIGSLNTDTQEIIAILKSAQQINGTRLRALTRAVQMAGYNNAGGRGGNQSSPLASRIAPISTRQTRQPIDTASNNARIQRARTSRANSSSTVNNANIRRIDNNRSDPNQDTTTRQRDANGRFSGGSDSGTGGSSKKSRSGSNIPNVDGSSLNNLDPIIESYKELKDVLSPLGKGAKFLFGGAKMAAGKIKALKRREPLPVDQDRHNNENEKLLDKIWKAILNSDSGGGGGAGLLGSLLGGGGAGGGRRRRGGRRGGGLGRGLRSLGGIKGLGVLATVAGGAGLAMDWDNLDHKGKSEGVGGLAGGAAGAAAGGAAGAAIGSVVPVVGTIAGGLVGGAIGAWIGSDAGEVIGGVASPYVQSWTQSMTAYNLPAKVEGLWSNGIEPFFVKMDKAASNFSNWVSQKYSGFTGGVKEFFGFGGGGDGNNGVPAEQASGAADYAIKNAATVSLGACAKYVNDAFRANGLKASGHGKDVAANLQALNKGKFEDVAYDENYTPQIGDVMSMPSSKNSKHGYGHAAVYTNQGWVSDFKQGEKYGNTAAPNADYYEDIQSGRIKPKIVRQINEQQRQAGGGGRAATSPDKKAKIDQAMRYFTSQGWTPEQAAGIVGNLQKESQFDAGAVGDGGKAHGIAQWHPDRQANFKKRYGKSIKNSSYAEQLAFVNFELTKGTEQGAGNRLKKSRSAANAGAVVSEFYERPADKAGEKRERASIASDIYKNHGSASIAKAKTAPSKLAASKVNSSLASNIMPASSISGTVATSLPAIKPIMLPKAPQPSQRIDSGGKKPPLMLQANSESIPQNISDRALAHAVTGGLGEGLRWG